MRQNIKTESLLLEMKEYQLIIQKYKTDPEYVNPNVPLSRAKEILLRLVKEVYLGYRID